VPWKELELGMVGIWVGRLRTYVLYGELPLLVLLFIAFCGLLLLLLLLLLPFCFDMCPDMLDIVFEADKLTC
jgi:hypothetical protein